MGAFKEIIKTAAEKYLLIVALVSGFLLRIVAIKQSLWMDEAISAIAARDFGYSDLITNFIRSDTHPPLYYLILKFWTDIFGYSEVSLRFPSIIFGVLTILFVYKIGRHFSRKVAIYSAYLTAFSPLLIYYSQEARMYALATLLVTATFYSFLEHKWNYFSITLLLLAATDYLPLLIIPPLWIYMLLRKEKRSEIKYFLIAHLPLAVFALVWYQTFIYQSSSTVAYLNNNSWWGRVLGNSEIKDVALVWVKFLIGRINFSPPLLYVLIVLLVSLPAAFGLYRSAGRFKKVGILWLWLLVPITLSFLMSLRLPGFSYFRLIFTMPPFILLICYGISKLKLNNMIIALLLFFEIIFGLIYLFNDKYWREDWKAAVPFIENRIEEDEFVFVAYPKSFTPYEWYSKKAGRVKSFNREDPDNYNKIYSLDYLMDLTDPDKIFYRELENLGFQNTEVYNFRGVGQIRYWVKI